MVQAGDTLLGKYLVERTLGVGGMGMVLQVTHLHLEQRFAIKLLLPAMLGDRHVIERFLREARSAAKLTSEHVCRVHDVGVLEDGAPFMLMEYMEGCDLRDFARHQGTLPPGVLVDFILQACEALAEAHAAGIVHRDIKPANLFVARRADGSRLLKILDFGISKAQVSLEQEITHTQAVLGTPAYMSPEQMRNSKTVDSRTDIWALGIVLYELLEGRRPFGGETFSQVCLQVGMDELPPMRAPLLPGLGGVVLRCLEKEPGNRFQNVAELATALAPYAQTPDLARRHVERSARMLGLQAALPSAPPPGAPPGAPGAYPDAMPSMITGAERPISTLSAGAAMVTPPAAGKSRRLSLMIASVVFSVLLGTGIVLALQDSEGDDAGAGEVDGAGDERAATSSEPGEKDVPVPDSAIVKAVAAPDAAPDAVVDESRDAAVMDVDEAIEFSWELDDLDDDDASEEPPATGDGPSDGSAKSDTSAQEKRENNRRERRERPKRSSEIEDILDEM